MGIVADQEGSQKRHSLFFHLLGECSCAIVAAGIVAPAISIIDKAIIENVSGIRHLKEGIQHGFSSLVFKPAFFFRQPSFLMLWGVYSGTYIVANTIEAFCFHKNKDSFYPKFIGSSIANVTLSVSKDRAFTRMFGKGKPKPLPLPSFVLFGARDSLTILAGFGLPSMISSQLSSNLGIDLKFSQTISQLFVPCAMQFLSCPLHLLGLDLYNRPGLSTLERLSFIRKEYLGTALARVGRIFPAFGIGGVLNIYLRNEFYNHFEGIEAPKGLSKKS
jgi:hypothetical protein